MSFLSYLFQVTQITNEKENVIQFIILYCMNGWNCIVFYLIHSTVFKV